MANNMENFYMFPNIFWSFNVINLVHFGVSLVVFITQAHHLRDHSKFSNTKLLNINILWPLDTHLYLCVSGSYSMLIFKNFALHNFRMGPKLKRHPQRVYYIVNLLWYQSQKYLLSIIRSNFENYELLNII